MRICLGQRKGEREREDRKETEGLGYGSRSSSGSRKICSAIGLRWYAKIPSAGMDIREKSRTQYRYFLSL